MKKIILAAIMLFSLNVGVQAQKVTREGSNFTQVSNPKAKSASKETKTSFTYTDNKGTVYPVFLSSTGKAFIKKVSKKTGKEYKMYVPDIGRQINPEAYREKKSVIIR